MIGVQFNVGKTRDALREAIGLLQDMTPVYEDVAEYMTEKTRQRFISGKAPDGTAWARKSEATLPLQAPRLRQSEQAADRTAEGTVASDRHIREQGRRRDRIVTNLRTGHAGRCGQGSVRHRFAWEACAVGTHSGTRMAGHFAKRRHRYRRDRRGTSGP